jgi:hypothetical protein
MELTPKEKQRFRSHITRDLESGDCSLWKGGKSGGHGVCEFRGKRWGAHRLAYTIFRGPIPDGMQVNHACNPERHRGSCVQPLHLYLGTQQQNTEDAFRHGTRGKLGWKAVREIRERYKNGETDRKKLAREYGVYVTHICRIVNGKVWKE